ncbi:MAG: glycosyltransferase involved in cell wall biosynthesis [Verrucomicrobiales bacterium]|jgi:glycosyltransferase involved in cell wall biosynthesis
MAQHSQRCKRIIHVPRRYVAEEWGGTETVILETARHQQLDGWQPEIVTSMALASTREDNYSGIPVRRYPYVYPFFGLSAGDKAAMDKKGGNLLSLSLFTHLFRSKNVRLFHAHALKRLGGEVRTAARLSKRPYVVSLHGGVFDVPEAELASMTQTISNKLEWGKPFGALFGSRRVLEDADHVICVGQGEMELAKKELSHDRITYLPNGVDTQKFQEGDAMLFRNAHQIPEDSFLVLCLSRIDTQKNQALLVDAFARLAKKEPNARLVLAGPQTQPEYAQQLQDKIAAANIGERVHFLPGMRNDDPLLLAAFHACDVFVLPSRHEPFGIVVLEAWSAGKPVIVSHVGGLRALVDDGVNGMFVNPDSATADADLEAKLHDLQSNPDKRRKLGEAGRQNALENYDWHRIVARLEELYQEAECHAAGK